MHKNLELLEALFPERKAVKFTDGKGELGVKIWTSNITGYHMQVLGGDLPEKAEINVIGSGTGMSIILTKNEK